MRIMPIKIILIGLIVTVNCFSRDADNWARPGKNGIFIKFGKELPKDFVYNLERKEKKSDTWKSLGLFECPKSQTEAKSRLLTALAKSPFYGTPGDSMISSFFKQLKRGNVFDSLYSYAASPLYLEASGDGFFDTDIAQGKKYEYRLTKSGNLKKAEAPVVISSDPFPGENPGFKAKSSSVEATGNSVKLAWSFAKNNYPFGIRVFREVYLQTNMQEINPRIVFISSLDGILAKITDTDVAENITYRYTIIPFDVFGNETPPSEAVIVLNVKPYGDAVMIKKLVAESSEKDGGIRLAWSYAIKKEMTGLFVFKSETFDSGFQMIATLPAEDTVFIDRNTEPVKSYYYFLIFNNVHGQSPPTSKVIGIYKPNRVAKFAPQYISVKRDSLGNKITWRKQEADTRGYYVYRGNGYNSPMTQISPFIKAQGMDGSFVDTARHLIPGITHSYAVASVNAAFSISPFSDTVYGAAVPVALPVPLNLKAIKTDKGVLLVWQDMKEIVQGVAGYKVYRCSLGIKSGKFSELKAVHSFCETNNYTDPIISQGIQYRYAITTLGNSNTESRMSLTAEYIEVIPKPFPPSGLRAIAAKNSILIHWDEPATTDIKEYRIYREGAGKKENLLAHVNSGKADYVDNTIEKNKSYYYKVSVVNVKGEESAKSSEVGVTLSE